MARRPIPNNTADAELAAQFASNLSANRPLPGLYNEPGHEGDDEESPIQDMSDMSENSEITRMIERARALAAHESQVLIPRQRQEERAARLIKAAKHNSLSGIKERVERARKPRMRTVEQYLCDHCDNIIPAPKAVESYPAGVIIKGNIYVADPSVRGGLVGNNFPDTQPGDKIDPEAVRETVLCTPCFLRSLGLWPSKADLSQLSCTKASDPMTRDLTPRRPRRGEGPVGGMPPSPMREGDTYTTNARRTAGEGIRSPRRLLTESIAETQRDHVEGGMTRVQGVGGTSMPLRPGTSQRSQAYAGINPDMDPTGDTPDGPGEDYTPDLRPFVPSTF